MPSKSDNENVYKRCDCTHRKQSTCEHPWFFGWKPKGQARIRKPLAELIGSHAKDRLTAEREAARVKVALQNGDDPKGAVKGDDILLADLFSAYATEVPSRDHETMRKRLTRTVVPGLCSGRPMGEWTAREATIKMFRVFHRSRMPFETAANRDIAFIRASFSRAIKSETLESTPFKRGGVAMFGKMNENKRTRRLYAGEEERLLAAAQTTDMEDLIVAALDCGGRLGDLTHLQVCEVNMLAEESDEAFGSVFFPAAKTKTKSDRRVPIFPRLRTILRRRLLGPDGKPLGPKGYVFGDGTGKRVASHKTAWNATVLRANGHTPTFVIEDVMVDGRLTRRKRLSPESRAHRQEIGLHFHDLRREAASRWYDRDIRLLTISRWLGHTSVKQTQTYLGVSVGDDNREMAHYVAQCRAAEEKAS